MSSTKKPSATTQEQETTAAELLVMFENGESTEVAARIRTLSQPDFVRVMRAVRTLERALSDYALSWQNAQYWGNGQPYPDERKAKAAGA
jgi:hypothetical protein